MFGTRRQPGPAVVRFSLLFVFLGVGVLSCRPLLAADKDKDPVYSAKPLSYWVSQAASKKPEAKTDAIIDALMEAYLDKDQAEAVCFRAVDALRTISVEKPEMLSPVIAALGVDRPWWVRNGLMEALSMRGGSIVPLLKASVEKAADNPMQARMGMWMLGMLGADAKSALPWLRGLAAKGDEASKAMIGGIIQIIEDDVAIKAKRADQQGDQKKQMLSEKGAIRLFKGDAKGDWPGLHGASGDNLCRETGVISPWPAEGPPLLWTMTGLGVGYANVSIVGDKLYTMGDLPVDDKKNRSQYVMAFDLKSRKNIWKVKTGASNTKSFPGTRSTPTIDGTRLYALATDGALVCLNRETGELIWQKNLTKAFGGKIMSMWQFSESPLVDGEKLVVTPGSNEAVIVALKKDSGDLIWQCKAPEFGSRGKDGAAYSSVVKAEIAGTTQYIQQTGRGLIGVDAGSGKFLWGYNRIANAVANITKPVVRDNLVFVTNSYGVGSALLELHKDQAQWRVRERYFLGASEFVNHHGGIVLVGDYVFGGHGHNRGQPTCIHLKTGSILWKKKAPKSGSASILYVDGHLIWRYDRGLVVLTEANPGGFKIISSFTEKRDQKGPMWTHPVVSGGKLYLRHHDVLRCYQLKEK